MNIMPIWKKVMLIAVLVPVFAFADTNNTQTTSDNPQSLVTERGGERGAAEHRRYEPRPGEQRNMNQYHSNVNPAHNYEGGAYNHEGNLNQDRRAYDAGLNNGAAAGAGGGVYVNPNAVTPVVYPQYPVQTTTVPVQQASPTYPPAPAVPGQ